MQREERRAEADAGRRALVDRDGRAPGPGRMALGADAEVAGIAHQEERRDVRECVADAAHPPVQAQRPLGDTVAAGAERDQVVGMMASSPGTGMEVVDLEAVTGTTTLDRTHPHVPCHHQGPEGGRNRFPEVRVGELVQLLRDHPHLPGTEDLGEKVGSQLETRGEGDPRLSLGLGGQQGVDKHLGDGDGSTVLRFSGVSCEGIHTDRGEGVQPPLAVGLVLQDGEFGLPLVEGVGDDLPVGAHRQPPDLVGR